MSIQSEHGLDLSYTQIMGVLNVTPDSFSDGGQYKQIDTALKHAEFMLDAGAGIIDVGGESTRPGAKRVGVQEELDRVCPVVERLVGELGAFVSVDTSKPEVMGAVLQLGVGMLNDVRSFTSEGSLDVILGSNVPLCIMHMQGTPQTMQNNPAYDDLLQEVSSYLTGRAAELESAGVRHERIVIDPGFGFGKTLEHNLVLLNHLDRLAGLGYPVLAGLSRKSMLGLITGKPVEQRIAASVASAVIAVMKGAKIIRVHDVEESADAVKVIEALRHI